MSKRIGLPVLIVTIGLIAATIYIWYNLIALNTDYGYYNISIRVLAIVVAGFSLLMASGCYATYRNFSEEDLEKIGNDATKK
jgi:hypothetical protein